MAVFRVERNTGYTVMSNHHLRNKELSLKAKGLLSQMLSLPEDWDYTLAGLSHINREKIDAIREAVKELEKAGYIVRSRERDEKGRLRGADYVIYEQPQPREPEAATSGGQPPILDLPTLENPTLDNPTLEKPTQEKPTLENPTQLNKDILSKEQSITDLSSTDSIPFHSLNPLPFAHGKTAKSILISCGARLAPFDIKELRDLMSYDELELDTLGDRKTALFLIMSDTDSTFNFVIAMLQSQLFNLLCDKADDEYGGKLPVHVRCLLDEFANIGQIPQFEKLIATIRSREISASIILQSQSQLKAIYKDAAEIILDNADSTLFLGGRGKNAKDISENLGRETIDSFNTSENRGTQVSHGLNYQKLGKELMTQDEIAVMDGGKCILQLRGVRPFFSDKYDITQHPNYKYLSDFDKKNAFDVERYMSTRPAIVKPDEPFDIYEIDLSDEDAAAE